MQRLVDYQSLLSDLPIVNYRTTVKSNRGFTLIELMIVLVIISILATIAIPNYRSYIVRNSEAQAQAQMQQIEMELNRWRASALSYRGFVPKINVDANNVPVYGYADSPANTFIYIPRGSNANNYNYKLTLVDGTTNISLVPTVGLSNATGRSWVMLAEPKPGGALQNADIILSKSNGLKCKGSSSTPIGLASIACGIGMETW